MVLFAANHSVILNADEKLEITTRRQLEDLISKEKETISNDRDLTKTFTEIEKLIHQNVRGMSRALLKFNGGSVHDYATIADDSPRPSRASRARRAATSAGIS